MLGLIPSLVLTGGYKLILQKILTGDQNDLHLSLLGGLGALITCAARILFGTLSEKKCFEPQDLVKFCLFFEYLALGVLKLGESYGGSVLNSAALIFYLTTCMLYGSLVGLVPLVSDRIFGPSSEGITSAHSHLPVYLAQRSNS